MGAGKRVTDAERGKVSNKCRSREDLCQARENMQPVPCAAKHASSAKLLGKTCNRCRARENMQPMPSMAKHAIGAEREKTCNRCRARLKMQAVQSSSAKHATDGEREKAFNCSLARKCAHQRRQRRCKFSSR